MKRIVVSEYGKIPRSELGRILGQRLQAFDEHHAGRANESVFDWSRLQYIRAKNYVGVVQVPGLSVEILPKVDPGDQNFGTLKPGPKRDRAEQNLLYMLSVARQLPILPRDLAALSTQSIPLLEALIKVFSERLLVELRNGVVHEYVHREENRNVLKGKLLLSTHVRKNAAHRERLFVAYDEFIADCWLNRILKAGCRRLLQITKSGRTQQRLMEALLYLSDAEDCAVQEHHFERLQLARNAQRYAELVNLCRMVLTESTPTPSCGRMPTFSLLFPMDVLFEQFIGAILKRYAARLGLEADKIHLQAARHRKWLLTSPDGAGRLRLRPDVLIDRTPTGGRLIIDTKWKRLVPDEIDRNNGVSREDLYQLYAYAHRYAAQDNVLLYPAVTGVKSALFHPAEDTAKRIRIELIDLSRDLVRDRDGFLADLKQLLAGTPSLAVG